MDLQARKRALLDQFERDIAPARLRLAQQLPQLWEQTYGYISQPPAAAKPSVMRAPTSGVAELNKRPRTEEGDRRMEPLFRECQKIIKKIMNIQSSVWFRRPVDPIKDRCPNYFHFVKHPMDLATIRTKLQTKSYRSPLEFRDDVDLVWANCALYNQEGQPARVDGDKCKAAFDRAWRDSGIEAQLQQIHDDMDSSKANGPLYERMQTVHNQLTQVVAQLPHTSRAGGLRGDMSFAEKRRLSSRLSAWLPADQQAAVLNIIAMDPRAAMAGDMEVEVTLDDLRADTLWRLQDLLDPPAPAPAAKQAPQQSRPAARPMEHGGSNMAEKRPPGKRPNGMAVVHSPAASESDSGEHSPNEVKGSTMDDPRHGATAFVRDARESRQMVDESATNPKEQSQFVKDRAARKADVNINTANWDILAAPQPDVGPSDAAPEGDDMWKSFQSIAEQKQQREEQLRLEAEQLERQRREERERQKREEEERQRRLREEEERQQNELQKQREAQLQKELEEIKAKAGTANLTQQSDVALLVHGVDGGLAAMGLELAGDDSDLMFEDDI